MRAHSQSLRPMGQTRDCLPLFRTSYPFPQINCGSSDAVRHHLNVVPELLFFTNFTAVSMAVSTSSSGSRPLEHVLFAVVALFTLFLSFAGARNGLSHTRLHGIHAASRDITSISKKNDISIREDPLSKNFLRRDVTGQAGMSSERI